MIFSRHTPPLFCSHPLLFDQVLIPPPVHNFRIPTIPHYTSKHSHQIFTQQHYYLYISSKHSFTYFPYLSCHSVRSLSCILSRQFTLKMYSKYSYLCSFTYSILFSSHIHPLSFFLPLPF
jgi:hypothetical protein